MVVVFAFPLLVLLCFSLSAVTFLANSLPCPSLPSSFFSSVICTVSVYLQGQGNIGDLVVYKLLYNEVSLYWATLRLVLHVQLCRANLACKKVVNVTSVLVLLRILRCRYFVYR